MFLRTVGKPFLRALVIPFFAVLLSAYMADAVVDWYALRARVAALPGWHQSALITALILGWGLIAGKALQPVWRQPFLAFLVRQPLRAWRWVGYLFPSVAIGLIPVAALAWLAPARAFGLVHYLCIIALACPIVIGASFRRLDFVLVTGAGVLVSLVGLLAYAYVPAAAYVTLLIAIIVMPYSVTPIPRQVTSVIHGVYAPLSGSGIRVTILRRDLRYLMRRQFKPLLVHWFIGLICILLMLAFRINGEQVGREALIFACLFFSVSIYAFYEILETLKSGLGKEIMRRRWPVTHTQRAFALLGLIVVLAGPQALLILLAASTMGPVNALVFVSFVGVTIVFSGMLFGQMLFAQRSANGLFLLLLTGHAVSMLVLAPWLYVLLAVVFAPVGFMAAARGFERFTLVTERLSLARLA